MSDHERDTAVAMDWSEQNSGSWRNLAIRRLILTSLLAGILLLGIASAAVNVAQAEPMPVGVPGNWAMIFNEEFSANGVNTALWTPEWPNEPMSGECTSPSLVSQPGNGYLYLQVRAQESTCGGTKHADTGALVESNPGDGKPGHSGFLYSYGYVEWHVYIVGWGGAEQGCPTGGCIPDWPALWSFPENRENEIDTMEGLRREACHTWWHHIAPIEETQGCQSGSYAGWHTYGADWEPGVLKFYYDGAQVGEVKSGYINFTPQYLIMDDVPPNGHGDQLVVPDEIVVDYARVWQHPSAPSVTTEGATGFTQNEGALHGSVTPNGADTHYYFEYGPTTAYGSKVPAPPGTDAGSGWTPVSASTTVSGLQPATTYHYRIVAQNSVGENGGGDRTFTTPPPPSVTTEAATGIQQAQATLHGSVNPNGAETHYYFQYGTTIGYGGTVPALPGTDVGSGTTAVSASAIATSLPPGTTFHYRLVASSWAGTTYANDQVFITPEAENSSRWAVRNSESGEQWIFYRASNGSIDYWLWANGWTLHELSGHPAAAGTTPTVVRDPSSGVQWVYYQGSNGSIDYWEWSNGWTFREFSGHPAAAGTSPTVVRDPGSPGDPNSNYQWVYYQGSNGSIDYWQWAEGWTFHELSGHAAAPGTSPTVVRDPGSPGDPNSNYQWVYYQGSNGSIDYWQWAEGWTFHEISGHTARAGTNPTVVRDPTSTEQWVYYQGSNGSIGYWLWAEGWTFHELSGHVAAAGTSPTVIRDPYSPGDPNSNYQWVYYRGSNGSISYWQWAEGWTFYEP